MGESFTVSVDSAVLNQLNGKVEESVADAKKWLVGQIKDDCDRYTPTRTYALRHSAYTTDDEIVYPKGYAHDVYYIEESGKHIHTDINPYATSHWFETAQAENGEVWVEGTKQRILEELNG